MKSRALYKISKRSDKNGCEDEISWNLSLRWVEDSYHISTPPHPNQGDKHKDLGGNDDDDDDHDDDDDDDDDDNDAAAAAAVDAAAADANDAAVVAAADDDDDNGDGDDDSHWSISTFLLFWTFATLNIVLVMNMTAVINNANILSDFSLCIRSFILSLSLKYKLESWNDIVSTCKSPAKR